MTCPMCQGKCCRDVDSGYRVEHMAAEVYLHACDCADGTWVNPDAEALDEVTAEAHRLSTAVDRLEGESLEVLEALGLHEDTEHAEALAHIQYLRSKVSSPRAHLDDLLARVEQGARAVERDKVAEWLERPCGMSGHDAGWCPACAFKTDIASAIRDGAHLPKKGKE